MGKIEKGVNCSVTGCKNVAVRSISMEKVESLGLKVEGRKRTYLCQDHYKEFKKKNKIVSQVDKWRWNA